MCKNSGRPVITNAAVTLYLLKNGKVIEEMQGNYNSYGAVKKDMLGDFKWRMDWDNV